MRHVARILWASVVAVLVVGVGLSGLAAAPPPSPDPSDLVVPGRPGLSSFERALVSGYDTENAWERARFISTPNDGWADRIGLIGKVSGTPEERAVAEYIRDALAPYLDEVRIREYITSSWDFRGSELRVVAPEADVAYPSSGYGMCYASWGRVDAHAYDVLSASGWADPSHFQPEGDAYAYSFNNTPDGIVGDLVWVGRGTAKEFDRAGDVRGKIPLILRDDYVTQWPTAPLFEANRRGAIATIFYGYHGEDQDPNSVRGDIVCPGPLPTFQTTANVARHLQALLEAGRVQVTLRGNANIVSDALARSVYVEGILWGSTYPDEFVLTGSQIDTWFYGPSNSNSGVATNLELARLFGSMKDTWRPARSLMWVMVGSEELGGPITTWFDWIGGSYNFVKQHPGIGAKIVGELDISNVGYPSASGFSTWDGSWEMQGMFKHAVRDLGYSSYFGMWSGLDPFADIWSYTAVAGGSGIICCSQSGYTSVYHTWNDTFDVQSKVQYERTGKLSALLLYRLAHSLFAPLDLASTLDWVADGLDVVEGLVPHGTRYDAARAAVESLRADWAALRDRMTALVTDYRAGRDRPGIEAEARGINGAILEARTHIVNWMITTGGSMGGWWFYHRGEIHASDLAYVDMALDAIQAGSVRAATRALREVFGMDWGHRMSHETYHEVVDDMMADLYWGGEWEQQPAYVDVHDELTAVGERRWDDARAGLLEDRAGLVAALDHDMEALAHHLGIAHDILRSAQA